MAINSGFVSIENLVSEVLDGLFDYEEKKYYRLALQKVLNVTRNINVHYVRSYKETSVELDSDLGFGYYPKDLVKLISVGIYKNGSFWSFTRKPEMAKTMTGGADVYDDDFNEGKDIPTKGIRFGATGKNVGYWVEDDENRRFFVRNYSDTKVLVRYRSNGIDCTTDNCVPYIAKDLIVNMAIYEFALQGIPKRFSGMELSLKQQERARHYEEYTSIEYEPGNMGEFMDSQFASYNVTVRR